MFKSSVIIYLKAIPFRPFRKFSSQVKDLKYSYSFRPGDVSLVNYTLGELVDHASSEAADLTAYVSPMQGIRKTFQDFKTEVDKMASGLIALGLKKGDRIGLCAPNIYEWPVTFFAAAKAGLITVNINPANQATELQYCLDKVNCKALVISETFRTQDFYKMLCSFIPELPSSVPGQLSSPSMSRLQSVILINDEPTKTKGGTLSFADVLNGGNSSSNETLLSVQKETQFDDAVNIQFTSGTTGSPKGAILTHHNVVNNSQLTGTIMGHDKKRAILCCLVPFYHSFGCVCGIVGSMFNKNTMVMPFPGFSGEASIKAIQDERCTALYGAPTMFIDILSRYSPGSHNLSSLEQVVTGGAPCPQDVMTQLSEGLKVENLHNGYGTTETSPAIALGGRNQALSQVTSGYLPPLQNVEVKVIDDNGLVLPIGTQGEVCVRGYNVFMGYWVEEGIIDPAVDEARWYHTGDLGVMDGEGSLKINGRVRDMVIRGGENLYPVEIENFLHTHPSIQEAHVCGVPDEKMGEELCAWVMLKPGEKVTTEDIKEFFHGKVSHFKIPRYTLFVDNFPKVPSGKVQKFIMTEKSKSILKL